MTKEKKQISRRTKIIFAAVFIAVAGCAIVVGLWFASNALFRENPRFVIREILLTCDAGYWNGKSENERLRKTEEFAKLFNIHYKTDLETNTFELDLAALRRQIMRSQPEIHSLEIRRRLPDMLEFNIRSRIPRADLGNGYFLDDDGTILEASYYDQAKGSLPLLNEFPNNLKDLKRGERVKTSAVHSALKFIRTIDTSNDEKIRRIELKQVVCFNQPGNKYTQCTFSYPRGTTSKRLFRIQIPDVIPDVEFRILFERLIPALEAGLNTPNHSGVIDLRYKGPAFSPQP